MYFAVFTMYDIFVRYIIFEGHVLNEPIFGTHVYLNMAINVPF